MNKTRTYFLAFIAAICLAAIPALMLPGCANQLQPGGAYAPTATNEAGQVTATAAPDMALFSADSAFDFANSTIDTAFLLERNNRQLLWAISPEIKHTLDKIRPQAVAARLKWAQARRAYLAFPAPDTLSSLQGVLAEMQRISAAATAALPPPTATNPTAVKDAPLPN